MGNVRLVDREGEKTVNTNGWDGTVVVDLSSVDEPRFVLSPDAPFDADDVRVREEPVAWMDLGDGTDPWWLLWLPSVVGLVALASAELRLLDGFAPASLVYAGVGLALLVASAAGTRLVFGDARRLADERAAWRPDPWLYLVNGTTICVFVLGGVVLGMPENGRVPFLFGVTVVSALASSIATGPIYLWNRVRTVGLGGERTPGPDGPSPSDGSHE